MTNLRWFLTNSEARKFARKVKGKVFKFSKREMESLGTKCEYYVRWSV